MFFETCSFNWKNAISHIFGEVKKFVFGGTSIFAVLDCCSVTMKTAGDVII